MSQKLHMNYRSIMHSLVLLFLVFGTTTTVVAQDRTKSFEKQTDLEEIEGIRHWLPIEINVKSGEQTILTVIGTQLLHDALLITTKRGGLAIDLDLVVLCPNSKQEFTDVKSYPSRLHSRNSLYRKKGSRWRLGFGKDCVVEMRDLGHPTIELTTPSLTWVELTKLGKLRAEEMVDERIRLDIDGLTRVDLGHVRGKSVHISVGGSSDLRVSSVESDDTKISLDGLANAELESLTSSSIEINQSGSSDLEITSINTNQLDVAVDGLTKFVAGTVQTPVEQSTSTDVLVSSLELRGSAEVHIRQLQLPQLDVEANGLTDLELGRVITTQLNLTASGSSDVSVKRLTTDESQIYTTGLSDVEIDSLESDMVEIHSSGSSDVEVRKAKIEHLDVQAKGISDVSVRGKEWSESWGR